MKSITAFCPSSGLASRRHKVVRSALLALSALCLGLLPAAAQTITSAVPGLISYQGKVTNASGALVGSPAPVNLPVIFRIWSHSSNSTAADLVYSEQQTVTISEGEFSVLIGQGTAVTGTPLGYNESTKGPPSVTIGSVTVFAGASRFLGVTIDDPNLTPDPEISPRQQIVTSAYAFRARYAEGLGSNGNFSVAVTDQGNFGVGLSNPQFPLTTATTLGTKLGLFGNFNYGIGIQLNQVQVFGAASNDDVVFGYGSSAALTETMRVKGNGNIGIGTATPTAKLDVNGAINVFDGGVKSLAGGIVSEGGGGMVNFGMNDTRFGTPQANTSQGGFFRVNTQGGSNLFQFYARPASSATLSEVMSITSAGNVGVGQSSPGVKLDVNGGIRAAGGSGYTFGGVGDTDGGLFSPADGTVTLWTNNAERLRVDSNGNLGIGTNAPGAKLHVAGGIAVDSTNVIEFGAGVAGKDGAAGRIGYNTYGNGALHIVGAGTHPNRYVQVHDRLGINTTTPSAPLHVRRQDFTLANHARKAGSDTNYGVYLSTNGGFLWQDGASATIGDNETINYAVLAAIFDGEVVARAFWVGSSLSYSDARAKNIVGSSDTGRDLSLLRDLRVRDFTWIDRTVDNHREHKKLVAQEVEQVFPQAVRRTPRPTAIPNIYQVAEKLEFNAVSKQLHLTVGKAHDLKLGDSVEIAMDQAEMREAKVTAVSGEREFTIACETAPKSAFVYGKYVTDFRAVDYDAIAMLNVSATQELARQVDALKASESRNAELVRRVAELEAKDRARDAKLAAIEQLISSGRTVMARPATAAAGEQE